MWSITNPNVTYTFVLIQAMALAVEGVFVFYTAVGAIVFTVMSCVAGAALRSTKSQVTKLFRQQPWTHFTGFALDTVVVTTWSDRSGRLSSALFSHLPRLLLWWPQLQLKHQLSKNKRKWQPKMTQLVLLTRLAPDVPLRSSLHELYSDSASVLSTIIIPLCFVCELIGPYQAARLSVIHPKQC